MVENDHKCKAPPTEMSYISTLLFLTDGVCSFTDANYLLISNISYNFTSWLLYGLYGNSYLSWLKKVGHYVASSLFFYLFLLWPDNLCAGSGIARKLTATLARS